MAKTHTAEQYAYDVLSGKVLACIYVKLACKRYFKDLETAEEKGYFFSEKHASHAIEFFARYLKHSKGSLHVGKPFELEPWQQFRIWNIYGWKKGNENGPRRFKTAYTEIPRKNGKTTEGAGVVIYSGFIEGEARAENYTAATKRDQAKICFDEASNMVKISPELRNFLKVSKTDITSASTGSILTPLSSDKDTLDGLNIHCAIIDELHAHKTSDVVDVLSTATSSRWQPLIFEITTAGTNKQGICYNHRNYTISVLNGWIEDDSWWGIIYTLDEGDDFKDPNCWKKANPNLGVSKSEEYLEDQVNKAVNDPTHESMVLRYDFNIWVSSYNTWISNDYYQKNTIEVDERYLNKLPCYGGLDIASTGDFNALALVFDDKAKNRLISKMYFWCPADKIDDRVEKQNVEFNKWVAKGYIRQIPGNLVDSDSLSQDIIQIAEQYNFQSLAFDRALAYHGTIQTLLNAGVKCTEQAQNIGALGFPTRRLKEMMLSGEMKNDGNPVMAWMFSNVAVYAQGTDPNANMRIHKGRSQDKVDGPVAKVMALAEFMENTIAVKKSKLNTSGF